MTPTGWGKGNAFSEALNGIPAEVRGEGLVPLFGTIKGQGWPVLSEQGRLERVPKSGTRPSPAPKLDS